MQNPLLMALALSGARGQTGLKPLPSSDTEKFALVLSREDINTINKVIDIHRKRELEEGAPEWVSAIADNIEKMTERVETLTERVETLTERVESLEAPPSSRQ